jgi:hypothetical protein
VSSKVNEVYCILLHVDPVTLFIFAFIILGFPISHDPYPGAKTDYCYDQHIEGKLCFETIKMCEKMQSVDEMARGSCHKDKG